MPQPLNLNSAFGGQQGISFNAPTGLSFNVPTAAPQGLTFGGGGAPGGAISSGSDDTPIQKVAHFGQSALESFPELFGIEPSADTQEFRAQHPVLGFGSQALGALVPYVGAAKALRAIPLAGKLIGAAEELGGGNSILRGAFGSMAEAAGVEAGRDAITATGAPKALYDSLMNTDSEQKPFGDQLGESAFNVLTAGALGGLAGGLAGRAAKNLKASDLLGMPDDAPTMLRARRAEELLSAHDDPADPTSLSPDSVARLQTVKDQLVRANLLQYEPTTTSDGLFEPGPDKLTGQNADAASKGKAQYKAFYSLENDNTKNDQIASLLNRNYAGWRGSAPDKLVKTMRFWVDDGSAKRVGVYQDPAQFVQDANALGLTGDEVGLWTQDAHVVEIKGGQKGGLTKKSTITPTDFEGGDEQGLGERLLSQDVELNKANDPAQGKANSIQQRLTKQKVWQQMGDGFNVAQDETGMFVVNKKIAGDIGAPAPGDRWFIARTDSDGLAKIVKSSELSTSEVHASGYFPKPIEIEAINDPLAKLGAQDLLQTKTDVLNDPAPAKNKIMASIRDAAESVRIIGQPTNYLAQMDKAAARLQSLYHSLQNGMEERVAWAMRGDDSKLFEQKKATGLSVVEPDHKVTQGLQGAINDMADKDIHDIRNVLDMELPIEKVREFAARTDLNGQPLISPKAAHFLEVRHLEDQVHLQRMKVAQERVAGEGAKDLLANWQSRQGHYGYTRTFEGAVKVMIKDEAGETVGLASGKDWAMAQKAADDIVEQWGKRGRTLSVGGGFDKSEITPEIYQRIQAKINKPGWLKSRIGLLGYDSSRSNFTKQDFAKMTEDNLRSRESYFRDLYAYELGKPLQLDLERRNAKLAARMEQSRRLMAGDTGKFGKVQNDMMDKALHAVGLNADNSASKIVHATQAFINEAQFNFFNIASPVTNMVGIFQTLLPNLSFVMHAAPDVLARNYYSMPLLNGQGMVKGGFHALSEIKVLVNAFRMIGQTPEQLGPEYQEFLQHLERQRIITPKFGDINMGVDGSILREPLEAFKSPGNFVQAFRATNTMMMTKSEELSRLVAVNAAYNLAKSAGLDTARTAIFARNLIEKTNYNYHAMDKALMFTTPLGSLAGTMKNWLFHYMSSMAEFASAGKSGIVPLMWQTGSTALLGGTVATPLVTPVANAFSQFFGNKDFNQTIYDGATQLGVPEKLADGLLYGLPSMLGVSLSAQLASPGSDPIRDIQMIASFAAFDRAKNLSMGVKDALAGYAAGGTSPFENPRARDEIIRGLAPRTIFRSMALGADGGIKSLSTGYDVVKDQGLGSNVLYAAGFTPTTLAKTYDVYNSIKDDQAAKKALTKELSDQLYNATQSGDDRLATRIYTRAMAVGVDTGTLLRGVASREGKQQNTQLEQTATPQDREAYSFMFNEDN